MGHALNLSLHKRGWTVTFHCVYSGPASRSVYLASCRFVVVVVWQILECLKYGFPAIFLPHWHVLITNACLRARETVPPFVAALETPYSVTNHFIVGGSMSVRLISLLCFLQNSLNDLSVTNRSASFSWPAEIKLCTWATVRPRISAVRSHENASSLLSGAVLTPS